MRAAAEKAIQLDPLLAEAHDALGMAYARDGQWEQSEKSFRRAIELDPSDSLSHVDFATFPSLAARPDRGGASAVAHRGGTRPAFTRGALHSAHGAHVGGPVR